MVVLVVIGSFGLASTTPLILQNDNSDYFQVISAVSQQFPGLANAGDKTGSFGGNPDDDKMTIIGSPSYYWILQYVFDKPDYNYKTQNFPRYCFLSLGGSITLVLLFFLSDRRTSKNAALIAAITPNKTTAEIEARLLG